MAKEKSTTGSGQPDHEEMVLTPGGWRPKSTVHRVEAGHHISAKGGRIRKIHTASGDVVADYGAVSTGHAVNARGRRGAAKAPKGGAEPYPDNGWIIDSEWTNPGPNPISYFATSWVVPPAPATDNGQTVFLFNGVTPADNSYILQPVLQWGPSYNGSSWWGGSYWAITNWYVPGDSSNPTFVGSALVTVNAGDSLQGIMTLTSQSGTDFNYQSVFAGYPTTTLTITDTPQQTVAYETLECYGITQASDYPDTLMTAMTGIEIKAGSAEASIAWTAQDTVTANGQNCVIVSNASPGGSVYLFYRQNPQNFYFVVDKSTFGKDEVNDVIDGASHGRFSNAFWLALDGYTPNQVGGATPVWVAGSTFNSAHITGLSLAADTAAPIQYELGGPGTAYGDTVQRIRFAYDITFTSTASFPAVGSEPTYTLIAGISIGGTVLSQQPETIFALLGGSNPYFTNVDQNNPQSVFYLSQDLRIFIVNAGQAVLSGAPAFTSDPYDSIQSFLYYLNHTTSLTQAYSGADPLNNLPNQTGYETGDSSVTPLNGGGMANYNFAIARVRLQGAAGTSSPDVRVFFRLWVAVSCDTDFQPSTTYPSALGMSGPDSGLPVFPQASGTGLSDPSGQSIQTIPFFATNSTGSEDYDSTYAPANRENNIQTITVTMGQDSVFAYFGCYLDVYNSSNNSRFPGTHHCIVAQIAYDQAPIPTVTPTGATPSPENFDKLAQRNLNIASSGNPGFPATHRVPQTFDTRPSPLTIFQPDGTLLNYPDELMIDWGNVPAGSMATIYWPQVTSAQVLQIAGKVYAAHCLTAFDANTVQCTVTGGVTYVPIPNAPGQNLAGLFTVDLPDGIRAGNEFNITIRRVTARQAPGNDVRVAASASSRKPVANWRCIAGTFQVQIPVNHERVLLRPEENLLAILKWRLANMQPVYRWYPVLQRYIAYISSRVQGMGGNPSSIGPSEWGLIPPAGHGKPGGHPHHHGQEYTGKVTGIIYDRFGDFEGFSILTIEGHTHSFLAHEPEMEELVNRAWTGRILISVFVERLDRHVPISVVLRRAPRLGPR